MGAPRAGANVIKLLTIWATSRLLRALTASLVVAALALLLLGSASRRDSNAESVV